MKRHSYILVLVIFSIFVFATTGFSATESVYGGVLRVIQANGPQMLSYVPMMGPGDHTAAFPAAERLVDTNIERGTAGGVEPVLCERWVEDKDNLTITWYVRKGVQFHDGSELTAEVVRWNFQMVLDSGVLPYSKYLKGMRILDKYTIVFDLTQYSNQLMPSWGWWVFMVSKKAFEDQCGGDLKTYKDWARTHIVGTGPFMLKDYKRDVHINWEKNPNYWRKGRPYLDGMKMIYIPDPVTASAMFQAGEADTWESAGPRDQKNYMEMGYHRQHSWPALGYSIWINTANPKSKWQDKRLREALEYALDKDTITRAIGFGLYKPLKSLPPEGEWGYDRNYNPRPYNPDKARQLLKDAGYGNGLSIKLLTFFTQSWQDLATAVKQYLDDVGFDVTIDVADPGRFFGSINGAPPGPDNDLALWITGRDTNYLQTYMRWFSTEPFTDQTYLGHTPEQEKLDQYAQSLIDIKAQEAATKQCMRYLTDNALIVPIFDPVAAVIQQPWVHSTRYEQGFVRWQTEEVWMEKH